MEITIKINGQAVSVAVYEYLDRAACNGFYALLWRAYREHQHSNRYHPTGE